MPNQSRLQSERAIRRWSVVLVFSSSLLTTISSSAQNVSGLKSGPRVNLLSADGQTSGVEPVPSGESGHSSTTIGLADEGVITGIVLDSNDALIPGSTVAIESAGHDRRTVMVDQNGSFEVTGLQPDVSYLLHVYAPGFAAWTSQPIVLAPAQRLCLADTHLRIKSEATVSVSASTADIESAQLKFEEQQRILGFIPNFKVNYEGDEAAPLTVRMKIQLATKVATDPVTVAGMASVGGMEQSAHTPNYQLGARGYGQRFGATAATGFSDILIGGAILPSVLHQDPRYFYQGTGTKRSRIAHTLLSPFITRGDDRRSEINFSSLGGDLASNALQATYLPASNRGSGRFVRSFVLAPENAPSVTWHRSLLCLASPQEKLSTLSTGNEAACRRTIFPRPRQP